MAFVGVKTLAPSGALVAVDGLDARSIQLFENVIDQLVLNTSDISGLGADLAADIAAANAAAAAASAAAAAVAADLAARTITAGTGLSGGGNLSTDRTISLANTAVTPGIYDGGSLTIDQQGRVTLASTVIVDAITQGADPTGVSDSRAAIITMLALCKTLGVNKLRVRQGTYAVSKHIDLDGFNNLHIFGEGRAVFRYQSDDIAVGTDGTPAIANSRSCFRPRYCTGLRFSGITLEGGTSPDISVANVGSGVYASNCVDTTFTDCNAVNGYSLVVQDATTPTTGTGDSLAVTAGVVTLTDAAAAFVEGHKYRYITISGCTNEVNNGTFPITTYTSTSAIKYTNADATNETSSFTWTVDDNDRVTSIIRGTSYGCRGSSYGGVDFLVDGHVFEQPDTNDLTGIGRSYAISGTTVTLKTTSRDIKKKHVGRYIKTAGSTSAANDGLWLVTSVTERTQYTQAAITFENASGVTEQFAGTWWLINGEKSGIGAGATALAKSGSTMTLTSLTAAFTSHDVGKNVRISNATTAANNGLFTILSAPSTTTLTYTNASGASETFAKSWTIDSYDRVGPSGAGFGSSHALYAFAKRRSWKIVNCTFRNIRMTGVKASGTTDPIDNLIVDNCAFINCGGVASFGADDTNEHSTFSLTNCQIVDCATGRAGWNEGTAIAILGSRSVSTAGTTFHCSRNAIGAVDGRGIGQINCISASRFVEGVSQPVEHVLVDDCRFTCDPDNTTVGSTYYAAVSVSMVGQRAHYRTGGTLTKSGNIMTLTDSSAEFSQQLVGRTIELINSASSNDVTDVIVESVPSGTTLTYTNAGGTGGSVSAGTYRIFSSKVSAQHISSKPVGNGAFRVQGCMFDIACATAITSAYCIGPEVYGNTFACGSINFTGDLSPHVWGNTLTTSNTASAQIRFDSGTSWPVEHDNRVLNQKSLSGTISARDWGIGVDSSTVVDYPLLGKRGRLRTTGAYEEVVVAYGSKHVDGDVLLVGATTCTYKASSPGANQFNTFATLLALINATGTGFTATDYGTGFASGSVTTQHLLIRRTAQSSSDGGTLDVRCTVLNGTALVCPTNHQGSSSRMWGRGSGSPSAAGPITDKSVIWSTLASLSSTPSLTPDNSSARALMNGVSAMGRIACAAKADFVDAETVTIADGINPAVVYEWDTNGVVIPAGNIRLDISGATTAKDCAVILRTAILANQPTLSVTSNYGDLTISAVDTTANLETLTIVGHGLITGDQVRVSNSGGALPTGLSASTDYWVIYHTADKIALATTLANALANTRINLTGAGSGTNKVNHGAITITNNWAGPGGNMAITETVVHASFQVYSMANGHTGSFRPLKDPNDSGADGLLKHARAGDFAGNNFITRDLVVSAVDFATNDTLTSAAHKFATGDVVKVFSTTTLPAPLAIDTSYYVIYYDDDQIQLATSWTNAMAGTKINITDAGTGTHTIRNAPVPEFRWGLQA